MKTLLINNKNVIISNDTYFPFTQKVNDLNNIEIIGIPGSKTVQIPRCPENDALFGYICDINRIVIDDQDQKIGISFNQTRKVNYVLMEDSEVRSEGLIEVVDIDDNWYSITLTDSISELLEELAGDEINNRGYLNNLDIIMEDDQPFSLQLYAKNVETLNQSVDKSVIPTFNVKEYDSTGTDAYLMYVPTSGSSYETKQTLPFEMTPIQFGSLKPHEVDYAIRLSSIFKSINAEYNDIIVIDESITGLTNGLYLKSDIVSLEIPPASGHTTAKTLTNLYYNATNYTLSNTTQFYRLNLADFKKNGIFNTKMDVYISITPDQPWNNDFMTFFNDVYYSSYGNQTEKIGELFITNWLSGNYTDVGWEDFQVFQSKKITTRVDLKRQDMVITENNGYIERIDLHLNYVLPIEFYPLIQSIAEDLDTNMYFDFTNLIGTGGSAIGPYTNDGTTMFFARWEEVQDDPYSPPYTIYYGESHTYSVYVAPSQYEYTKTDIRSGDIITGKNILPNITIQNFLLSFVKLYNLDIRYEGGKIKVGEKKYTLYPDYPRLKVNKIIPTNYDFTTLTLSTGIPDNEMYSKYEKATNRIYGQKVINTNYNIKKNVKDIKFDVSIPGILYDYNSYAYDIFSDYYNGGYSKERFGDVTGYDKEIVFAYINRNVERMFVCDDSFYEAGMKSIFNNQAPEDVSFILGNVGLKYYENTGKYVFNDADGYGYRIVQNYATLSPYKLNGDEVLESLEMSKPAYNFAGFTDATYTEQTTLYNRIWKNYIEDIYNVNTHILDVDMVLEGKVDIYGIFNYGNNYYTFSDIPEYDPTVKGIYNVKLLKINNLSQYVGATTLPITTFENWTYDGYNVTLTGNLFFDDTSSPMIDNGFVWSISNNTPTILDNVINKPLQIGDFIHTFTATNNVTYYYRTFAKNSKGIVYSDVNTINVSLSMLIPALVQNPITDIDASGATFKSTITNTGNLNRGTINERGFCWSSTNTTPTKLDNYDNTPIVSGSTFYDLFYNGQFQLGLTYYVRGYAMNEFGVAYTQTLSFQLVNKAYNLYFRVYNQSDCAIPTIDVQFNSDGWLAPETYYISPVLSGETYTQLFTNTIKASYIVDFSIVMERNNNMIEDFILGDVNNIQLFEEYIHNVEKGLTEYQANGEFRITYDNNSDDVYISMWVIPEYEPAQVELISNSNNGYVVTLNGDVTYEGSSAVSEKGFIYSTTNSNPTLETPGVVKLIDGTGLGTYTKTFTASNGITYYVKAYATNSYLTSYSTTVYTILINQDILLPQLQFNAITNVTYNDAEFVAYVSSEGKSPITERGFVWSTTTLLPTTGDTKQIISGTTGDLFYSGVDRFTYNNYYYVRAYAKNSFGIKYSNMLSFTPTIKEYDVYARVYNYSSYGMMEFSLSITNSISEETITHLFIGDPSPSPYVEQYMFSTKVRDGAETQVEAQISSINYDHMKMYGNITINQFFTVFGGINQDPLDTANYIAFEDDGRYGLGTFTMTSNIIDNAIYYTIYLIDL